MSGPIDNEIPTFVITDANLYVLVVTLPTQDNKKLIKQLKSGFIKTIQWNQYQSKATTQTQNQYLDVLTDLRFQGVNRVFVLSFESYAHQQSYKQHFPPTVAIKDYNIKIDRINLCDQPVKINIRIYGNFKKIKAGQEDDCTTCCLLDYVYLKIFQNVIALDLCRQQALDVDLVALELRAAKSAPDAVIQKKVLDLVRQH